jgi:hypothetical protein
MKLPVEIRHIIYNLLLAELTEDRSELQFREEFPGVTMGQGFRFKVFETDHDDSGDTGLLWQRPYYEVEIKEVRVPPFDEKCYSHPDRGSNFALPGTCDDLGMKECQAIHHLSHVSRQFTSELGECLWGNAVINIQCPDLFFDFFEDRPQIWKHVKGISLFIYWTNIDDSANFGALLLRISKFVSRHLDLRVFSIHMVPDYHGLTDISRFERLKSWITAFRGLKIGEKFTVHIEPFTVMSNLDHRVNKLSRRLSDLWLPDSLRAAKVKA